MNALVQPVRESVTESVKESVHHLHANDFTQYSLLALLDEARLLMHQERSVQYRLAAVLRELDAREHLDGKPVRLTRWLHDDFGLTFGAAREKVRTARALGDLPLIDEAFRDGQLSYSKVRALTRAATPDNETELLERARNISAEGVEQLVRRVKLNECLEDAQAMIRSRALSTRWDETGMLIVQGKLTPEQGEVFLQALAKATEALADSDTDDTYWAKRADALAHLMADSLSEKSTHSPGDRHQLMVHVSAETLAGQSPEDTTEINCTNDAKNVPAETFFHPETLRRLACDGGMVTVIEKADGNPLSIGRKSRVIPPSMRRALVARDRHCQYPGCAHERYVEGHHMVHWAHGGVTRLDNLVLLCSHHHRKVHEMGERIQRAGDDSVGVTKMRCLEPVYTGSGERLPV